jgi:PAS domain-containing protein
MAQETDGERLAAEKHYFAAVLDSMSDGVLVCDGDMRVTTFNAAAAQRDGIAPRDRRGTCGWRPQRIGQRLRHPGRTKEVSAP